MPSRILKSLIHIVTLWMASWISTTANYTPIGTTQPTTPINTTHTLSQIASSTPAVRHCRHCDTAVRQMNPVTRRTTPAARRVNDEARLHFDVFNNSRSSHPTHRKLIVAFKFTLISIVDFDIDMESIVIMAWITQHWNNPTLSWDPNKYGGVKRVNIRSTQTWTPDIYAYGNVESQFKYNGLLSNLQTQIVVDHHGNHTWLMPITMKLGCGMNVKDFPFETQTCPLLFGSFTYDSTKVVLIPTTTDLGNYEESSVWTLQSMEHVREDTLYPGVMRRFSDVKYTVVMKRKPLYVIMNLLLPCLTLAFLTLMVYVQPVTTGERCVYVITIVVSVCWYVTSVVHYLPSSSEGAPLSQLFLGMSLSVFTMILFSMCYSIGIYYGNLSKSRIPALLRIYVLEKLAPHFGYHTERKYPVWRHNLRLIKEAELQMKTSNFSKDGTSEGADKNCSHENLLDMMSVEDVKKFGMRVDIMLAKLEDDDDDTWLTREWNMCALAIDHLFVYCSFGLLLMEIVYCIFHILHN